MSKQYKRYLEANTRVFYDLRENDDRGVNFTNRDAMAMALLRQNVDMIVLRKTKSNLQEWKIVQSEYGYLDTEKSLEDGHTIKRTLSIKRTKISPQI